jgi:hypothetical protein
MSNEGDDHGRVRGKTKSDEKWSDDSGRDAKA